MTVKITKPEFNIRDKLSELDRKPGDFGGKSYKADSSDEWNKITNLEASESLNWDIQGVIVGVIQEYGRFREVILIP